MTTEFYDRKEKTKEIIETCSPISIFGSLSNLDRNFILKNHLQHLIPFGIQAKKICSQTQFNAYIKKIVLY
jgi:hypothetical protein